MRISFNNLFAGISLALAAALCGTAMGQDHLLLSEAVATPTTDEFIEIGNPTDQVIALDDYYLSDDMDYALLPGQFGDGPAPDVDATNDFIARFPAGATIAPGQIVVIAFNGATFTTTFGFTADYELLAMDAATPDMLPAYDGSIGTAAGLTNSGESATLFFWDGASDLVSDVDMVIIGTPTEANSIGNKTGLMVDGPDAGPAPSTYADDAFTMPQQTSDPGFGVSTKRIAYEDGFEVQNGNGNGITGHDETSEDILSTWDSVYTAPDPGASLLLNPPMGAAISIAKSGPALAIAGTQITYTLSVENVGTDAAENVAIIDTLPAGLVFVSEVSPEGVTLIDNTEPDIQWSAGSVASGASFTIELTVAIGEAVTGEIVNTVELTTTTKSDDPEDNSDEAATTVSMIVTPPDNLRINEIRIEQPGADNDEYFELKGDPNTSLNGLAYIVIGDGTDGDSGVVEDVISLSGTSVGADGLYLAAEASIFTLTPVFLLDLDTPLNFEGSDNVTHLVVANFSGAIGQDLDVDNDGMLDEPLPWTDVVDAVGLIEPDQPPTPGSEYAYGASLGFVDVGPDGDFVPGQVYRCETQRTWTIGVFDPFAADATDTPAATNLACQDIAIPGDTNGDGQVNVTDLINVINTWGSDGQGEGFDADLNGDNVVDVTDLIQVINGWTG